MSSQFELKALIFDMDGVLVDSEPCHLQSYQELLGRFDIPYTAEDNKEFLGRKDHTILEILNERYGLKSTATALVAEKEAILARLLASAVPRPGVLRVLEQARRQSIPTAVASSATLPTIELVVDVLKIREYFQTLTSGDEVTHGKPAPDVFLLAASRLGAKPENCLVIEDTYNGVKAAKAAGMYCVAIPCEVTAHQDHSAADMKLRSLEELDISTWIASPNHKLLDNQIFR
jgi:beta-phosphoglucomutase family hydrolase